jgi:hypothetical protein
MACTRFQVGNAVAFACTRGPVRKHRCSCGAVATKQCDAPLRGKKQGQTCDKYLCDGCAVAIGPEIDLCPAHARETREHPGPQAVIAGEGWFDPWRKEEHPKPPPWKPAS